MHKRLVVLKDVVKVLLLLSSPFLIFYIWFFIMEWRKYCEFDYPDISKEQVFECKVRVKNAYQTRIFVEGEFTDTIQVLLYNHRDPNHTYLKDGIPEYSVESHKFTGAVDTMVLFHWYCGNKIYGVIKPSSNTKGHLNVGVYFRTMEYF